MIIGHERYWADRIHVWNLSLYARESQRPKTQFCTSDLICLILLDFCALRSDILSCSGDEFFLCLIAFHDIFGTPNIQECWGDGEKIRNGIKCIRDGFYGSILFIYYYQEPVAKFDK